MPPQWSQTRSAVPPNFFSGAHSSQSGRDVSAADVVGHRVGVLAANRRRRRAGGLAQLEERRELRDVGGANRGRVTDGDRIVFVDRHRSDQSSHGAAIVDVVLEALAVDAIRLLRREPPACRSAAAVKAAAAGSRDGGLRRLGWSGLDRRRRRARRRRRDGRRRRRRGHGCRDRERGSVAALQLDVDPRLVARREVHRLAALGAAESRLDRGNALERDREAGGAARACKGVTELGVVHGSHLEVVRF